LPIPRSAEKLPAKVPGEFRVLVYGGSTVVGLPEPKFGFVPQMRFYLGELLSHEKTEIFSYAVSGQPSAYVVSRLDQTVRGSEADAIVVLTAHNEFIWANDMRDKDLDVLYAIQERLHRSAMVRRVRRLGYRYHSARQKEDFASEKLIRVDRASARFRDRVARYERNVKTIVGLAREAEIPLFFCTGPCNLADWGPNVPHVSVYRNDSEFLPTISKCIGLFNDGKMAELPDLLKEAAEKYPEDAVPVYLDAKVKVANGAMEEAKELFVRAKDMDRYPFRVLSGFNERVREQGDRPGVHIVDLDAIFNARSRNGITGFELIADNCHPTPEGGRLIATSLIEAFRDEGLIAFEGETEQLVSLEEYFEKWMDAEELREARVDYFLASGKECIKGPYHKVNPARKYLNEVFKYDADNWAALANLATTYLMEGDKEEGEKYLRRAIASKGSPMNSGDWIHLPLLENLMEAHGLLDSK